MAKHCTVCNQDYPDDLAACPHCAEAKKTQQAGRAEDRSTQLADQPHPEQLASEAEIDLGQMPSGAPATGDAAGAPPSGISDVAWAALVEEPDDKVKIDSPSDVDLLKHSTEAPAQSERPHSDSVVDLGAPVSKSGSGTGPTGSKSDSEFFMAELASGVSFDSKRPPSDHSERPHSESSVDLGAPVSKSGTGTGPSASKSGSEVFMAELASGTSFQSERPPSDSAVDLGAPGGKTGSVSGGKSPSESEVFMAELASGASQVDYVQDSGIRPGAGDAGPAAQPGAGEQAPRDRDEIVEAVEASPDQGAPAAEVAEDAALDVVGSGDDSSAVDLGAPPPPVDVVEVEEAEAVEVMDEGGVNLEGLAVPAPSGPASDLTSDSSVDLGSQAEIAMPDLASEAAAEHAGAAREEGQGLVESSSEVALEDLDSEKRDERSSVAETLAAEEPPVSEAEVNELLANLEETPSGEAAQQQLAADEAEGEAAIAAAEQEVAAEEEQAAAEAEEEEKPAKPARQASRAPALVGGALLGILLGAGGVVGARFAGVDVPALVGAGEKEKQAGRPVIPPQGQPQPQPQAQAPTAESRAAMIRRGDWEEATKAGIEQIDESKPEELAARGDVRLHSYLQNSRAKVNLQDPALQLAIADLAKAAEAKNPDAMYELGLINELANKLPEARTEYTKGVQAFQNDPVQKRRFQSALHRVELKSTGAARGAFGPLPERAGDRAALLALLLIGLQQPQPAQPQPEAGGDEAGFEFWEAAKLAREGKFADAMRMIDKARALHDQRRFSRLRKAQNPLSDPTEDIFLRCCEELKNYWALESHLRDGGYLTDRNTPLDAVQDAMKKAEAGSAVVKEAADTLIKDKVITRPEDLPKGLNRLIADKKSAESKVAQLTTELKKSQGESMTVADKLKAAEAAVKERDGLLKAAAEREMNVKVAYDNLHATLKQVTDDLAAARLLDPKAKPDVKAAVRRAIEVAKTRDPQGDLRKQGEELARLRASMQSRRSPEEMMPLWLLVLEQNRTRTQLAEQAEKDSDSIQAQRDATPVQKGQAQIVRGLALRNTEKFAEARTALEAGRSAVDRAEWLAAADAALREVSDPVAYFASQAESLYNRGRMDEALALLERAMKLLPAKEQGRLLARRSLIELDAARTKVGGLIPPTQPLLVAARRDADVAVKTGAAEGHYAAGRIAEETGQPDAAIQSYRQALAAHPAMDADGSRYRIALARVLSQPREVRRGPAPAAANKVGWSDPAPYPARYRRDVQLLLLASALGLQAPGLIDDQPGMEEAEKLADEVLKAPAGKVPFDVRSQALAVKGRWTLALQSYVEGLRPFMPREYSNGLVYLILNHPRLKRPDSLRIANPMEAEKHFAAGLNFYFERDYANAEKEFVAAVENDGNDARYFYFLGLSRLAQNKRRDARDDFDQGATLERLNRPAPAAVSESLERIQGPTRRIVNDIRYRPER
jgi:hypothetical protein